MWLSLLLATGSVLGTLLYRRRTARLRTRIDLYFADGSMLSLALGSPDADAMLESARQALGEGS
jgi:hypothetical protein